MGNTPVPAALHAATRSGERLLTLPYFVMNV